MKLEGTFEILLNPIHDERGFFMRTFDHEIMKNQGLSYNWLQENHSQSIKKGIIRGLHFQFPPYSETKLVRCTRGSIQDVFVDLRKDSPTFGKWDSIILSESRKNMALIPRGFAHGFCTLEDTCEVLYKVDNYYNKEFECGLIWNDPDLEIEWFHKDPQVSDKDQKNLLFRDFKEKYASIPI